MEKQIILAEDAKIKQKLGFRTRCSTKIFDCQQQIDRHQQQILTLTDSMQLVALEGLSTEGRMKPSYRILCAKKWHLLLLVMQEL
ncbi:hypothetical protein GOP47_0000245 [Adiantum capillus-veneris]|uniref:Uncharacterized protein n=1 Tax=Adiantum capillus-veneris TaxID=13818 RepID=A0A9D4VCN6_ADICA|nr:hypothetical protein GOP47_0000245 [Adiantum capillus-veneris]